MKLKKGDKVQVIRGKDKGKTGNIEKMFPKEEKVLVSGINNFKRHLKANSQKQKSEIITIQKPVSISSVILICPKCNTKTRVGYAVNEGKKVRICKKCGEFI